MNESVTASDDAVQASVLAGAFHALMFLLAAGALLLFGLPRAAGAAALLGGLLWAASLLHWLAVWAIGRFTRHQRLRRAAPQQELAAPR